MREILFRAKSKYGNEWVYGVPITQERNTRKTDEYAMADAVNYDELDGYNPSYYFEPIKKETVDQYTGIEDKNGKKIFEGDIVKTEFGRLCKIEWFTSPCNNCWDMKPVETRHKYPNADTLWRSELLEIVGNIHDNPELLKEGNE